MSRIPIEKVPEVEDRSAPIFAEFDRLAEAIRVKAYNLFSHRGQGDGHALDDWLAAEREFCWSAAELAELDGEYKVKMALAGFDPKEVSVTATPNELIVRAHHEQRESGGGDEALEWSEFRANDVMRRFEMSTAVDVDGISADLKNGLLEITAPKSAAGLKQESAASQKQESAQTIELSAPS